MKIAIPGGKGGTGKTSLAACFAQLAAGCTVSDCDVDAADLHVVLNPEVEDQFTQAQIERKTLLEYGDGRTAGIVTSTWEKVRRNVAEVSWWSKP